LVDEGAHLLLRPQDAGGLSATLQTLGRRFVVAYNARHGRSGTPWNGRFRAAPLQPGTPTMLSLRVIASLALAADPTRATRWSAESATWQDPPELWSLGNTPFEREQAYGVLLQSGVETRECEHLLAHVRRGLPFGDALFLAGLQAEQGRPAVARRRGRPARLGTAG
jgi:putative transposase